VTPGKLLLLLGLALVFLLAWLLLVPRVEVLIGALVGAAVVAGLAAYLLLMPMLFVRRAATLLAGGNLAARARVPNAVGPSRRLIESFNSMANQLQAGMAAASEEESRLVAALNSSIDAVAALDGEGRVLFANLAFEHAFGRELSEVAGRPFVWVLPDEEVLEAVRASRERGQRQVGLIERPGRRFLQVVTTPIAGGGEWAVLVVFHDLTDVKRTEQVRRDFIANVSHELRTPLAALKSVVETLMEGALTDESVAQEFLRRADSEVDRLVALVEELLELSRIESGEQPLMLRPTEMSPLLSEAAERLRPQAERKQIVLDVELAEDLGEATVDSERIERAVLNLLNNAIKFTPPGGKVWLNGWRNADQVILQVRDTGEGIAPLDLPRIFERFYKSDLSRASRGSGLGLALVKHTVEAHGGTVSVESEQYQGSVFRLAIPDRQTTDAHGAHD
jgi:two-component system phosphate regulon sensor histidine kinase PhoR